MGGVGTPRCVPCRTSGGPAGNSPVTAGAVTARWWSAAPPRGRPRGSRAGGPSPCGAATNPVIWWRGTTDTPWGCCARTTSAAWTVTITPAAGTGEAAGGTEESGRADGPGAAGAHRGLPVTVDQHGVPADPDPSPGVGLGGDGEHLAGAADEVVDAGAPRTDRRRRGSPATGDPAGRPRPAGRGPSPGPRPRSARHVRRCAPPADRPGPSSPVRPDRPARACSRPGAPGAAGSTHARVRGPVLPPVAAGRNGCGRPDAGSSWAGVDGAASAKTASASAGALRSATGTGVAVLPLAQDGRDGGAGPVVPRGAAGAFHPATAPARAGRNGGGPGGVHRRPAPTSPASHRRGCSPYRRSFP